MLKARRPVGAKLLLENLDEPLGQNEFESGVDICERIKRCRVIHVRRVDDADIVDAVLGHKIEYVFEFVAVRVDET